MPPPTTAVDAVWAAHRKWSAVAEAASIQLRTWRLRNLVLLVAGAVLGALAAQSWLPDGVDKLLAGLSAVVLAVAAWVQQTQLGKGQVRRHTTARAASEALKSAVYWYRAGVAPYADDDRDDRLDQALHEVDEATAVHQSDYARSRGDGRTPPSVTGIADYVTKRAVDQRDWHEKKIDINERMADRLRRAESTATLLAAVLGGLTALFPVELEAWIGLLTTVGATFAAHLLAAQYDKLAASYGRTATRLTRLLDARDRSEPTAESDAAFVRSVEEVLAIQNEGWVALLET